MIRWLLRSIIILAVFVPVAACLPLAALTLTRTAEGNQFLFWCGPWSACFWTLLVSQVVGFKVWRGAAYVRQLRKERGGYLHTIPRACAWMFAGLFLSYAAELALILCFPYSLHILLPFATYSPVLFALLWCSRG